MKERVLGFAFLTLLLATAGLAQVTVVGTDTYPADVGNIQAAVGANTTVYLSGIFNFGADGSVLINVPNVTLEGVSTGATIKGGKNPITTYDGTLPSGAKNVTIRNIHFVGWNETAICHLGVLAEDNHALIEGNTFNNTVSPPDPFVVFGINYGLSGGSAEIKNNTLVDFSYRAISIYALTLHADDHVLVEGNTIMNSTFDGIIVELWDPWLGDLDNGPVNIKNNKISIDNDWAWGIGIGGYGCLGASNVVVEGNMITGYGNDGITAFCFGHNRKIINNDLTGLMTNGPNILACGRGDLIAGNVLGTTDIETAASYGELFAATGIWLCSRHPAGYPDPLPVTGNILADNDFRGMGLKGWAYDASGNFASAGCVLLLSLADLGWARPWPGAHITDNFIKETGRFPRGTGGPKQQVLEFPVYAHDNRIVGHAANEYAQLEAANPGIGQKIKESVAKFMERLQNRQTLLMQSREK